MAKGLFYCQHLYGVGNLIRSLNICRSLVQHYDIDFILGGIDIHLQLDSPRFRKICLPPFTVNSSLYLCDPYQKLTVEQLFEERKKIIEKTVEGPYSFVITSGIPFTKPEFIPETIHIIEKAKEKNKHCLVVCAQRDIASKIKDKNIPEMKRVFDEHYNYIFVQSDPTILRLEDSLSFADEIEPKTIYTGFVTQPDLGQGKAVRLKRILVSMGGGFAGDDLMRLVARVAPFFPQYEFLFILGPYANISLVNDLEQLKTKSSNLQLSMFMTNFPKELSQSALSISLAGSTIVDACYTHTPAIVYPFNFEQHLRAQKFADKGIVKLLPKEHLDLEMIQMTIRASLSRPYPDLVINCSGADNTAKTLLRLAGSYS